MKIIRNQILQRINFKFFRKKKKNQTIPQVWNKLAKLLKNLLTWGAQGQMTQINLIVNSLPRDLSEFAFFIIVGFTAGSIGLI